MTNAEWLECASPMTMLQSLSGHPDREKLRLLACRLCLSPEMRRLLESRGATGFIAAAELHSAGLLTWEDLVGFARQAPHGKVSGGSWRSHNPVRLAPSAQALCAVAALTAEEPWDAAWGVVREGVNLLGPEVCQLIRELFDSPTLKT